MKEKDQRCMDLQESLDRTKRELNSHAHLSSSVGTQVSCSDNLEGAGGREQTPSLSSHYIPTHTSNQRLPQPMSTTAATTAMPTSVAAAPSTRPDSGGAMRRFPAKDRIKSPRRRSLRSVSPRTSSGDLLDSSLDHEMRAAGFEVNDSFDSSEGVGFSDPNLDGLVLESDPSFDARDEREKEIGGTGGMSQKNVGGLEPSTRTIAWEEKEERKVEEGVGSVRSDGGDDSGGFGGGTDQAQATSSGTVEGGGEGTEGQELLSSLLGGRDGDRQQQQPDEREDTMNASGQFSCSSEGELLTVSPGGKGQILQQKMLVCI